MVPMSARVNNAFNLVVSGSEKITLRLISRRRNTDPSVIWGLTMEVMTSSYRCRWLAFCFDGRVSWSCLFLGTPPALTCIFLYPLPKGPAFIPTQTLVLSSSKTMPLAWVGAKVDRRWRQGEQRWPKFQVKASKRASYGQQKFLSTEMLLLWIVLFGALE